MFFMLGALLYRIRGGFDLFPIHGTQMARMMWCLPLGILAGLLTLNPYVAVLTAVMAFLGLMTPLHGYMMIWPVAEDGKTLRLMACIGLGIARMALILAPTAFFGNLIILAFAGVGVLHALAYWLGWKVLPVLDSHRASVSNPVDAETAWGELLWGGVQMEALALALVVNALL